MGEVWRARDTRLGREVALKVLPVAFANDRERMVRFQREAQLLAAFNHQNIAAIYSFENVEGIQLLVMEMVPGDTVKQLLAAGPLPVPRALAIARQTAEALDAAHGKGILHRDLKPANVKVTPDGKVKLLDFGLAKAFGPGPNASDISESPTLDTGATLQGMVLGTAPYMSPEQARGRTLDWRSDVWSFGCLLFEMLSGTRAFGGASASDILVAILEHQPDWTALPKETPPRILALLEECLAKDPEARVPDMAHVRQQLDAAIEGKTLYVPRSSTAVSARIRRAPRAWATAGVLLAVAVAALLYVSLRGKDTSALPASKLLAILPATDLTGRGDGRQLCDGVSFSLGVKLQSVPGIAIMPASTPAMLRETDPSKWARDTGANLLVQPAVRQMGDQRQISFSVSLAGSPVQIAAGDATGPAAEHFRLEDELTQKLVAALQIHLTSTSPARTPASASVPAGAPQTDYVVALGYLERYDDKDSVQKAIDLLLKIPGADSSALVQAALGRAYLASYDLSKDVSRAELAKTAAERAIALDANLSEAQVTYGRLLLATGETAKGVEVLKKAVEKRPDDAEGVRALAFALNKAGRLEEAETAFSRLVELRPRAWSAYSGLGYFYFSSHRYPKAAEGYRKGVELNPDVARLHYNLGATYLRMRRYPEAEKAFQRSIQITPQPTAFSNLGTLYYLQGRYSEAGNAYGRAVQLNPFDFWDHKNLADALSRIPAEHDRAQIEYAEAKRLAKEALRLDPQSGEAHAVVAAVLARTSRPESGLQEVGRALSLEPDNPLVLQCAILVFLKAEKTEKALATMDHALENGVTVDEIENEPEFALLRDNARYRQILDKHQNRKENS
jgi:serine/threonine-protein kinase